MSARLLQTLEEDYQATVARPERAPAPVRPLLVELEQDFQSSLGGSGNTDDEQRFQQWYAGQAKARGLNPDPDDPRHFYDYRSAFLSGAGPDASGHWPSQFKREGHPNLIIDGIDTRTGRTAALDPLAAEDPTMAASLPRIGLKELTGYSPDAAGAAQAGKDLGRSTLQALAAPSRALVDATRLAWGAGTYPMRKIAHLLPNPDKPGTSAGDELDEIYQGQMQGLEDLKEKLTFVEEPLTDVALSFALGGGAGAGYRALKEAAKPAARIARMSGITEPLSTTFVKSGTSALIGDTLLVDPATAYVQERLEGSDLSPNTKAIIAIAAPLVLGLVSGATLEARADRLLKNPLAMGLFGELGAKNATAGQVFDKFKQAIDQDTGKTGIGKLAAAERELRPGAGGGKPPAAAAEPIKEQLATIPQQQLGDEINQRLRVQAPPSRSAREAAEAFEPSLAETPAELMRRLRPATYAEAIDQAVDARTGKSAQKSAQDMLNEQELLHNEIARKRIPAARRQADEQPGLVRMIGDAAAGRAPSTEQAAWAVRQAKLNEIAQVGKQPLAEMDEDTLRRNRMVFAHNKRQDLVDIVNERLRELAPQPAVAPARQTPTRAAAAKGETLRWRIQQMDGIDFLHFKGEARDIPPMVRRSIGRKDGTPIDLAQQQLREEGWLRQDEDLLELLRTDPEALRRRHPDTDLAGRKGHLTERERRAKEQLEYEEQPPEGFEELPGDQQPLVAGGQLSVTEARRMAEVIGTPNEILEKGATLNYINKTGEWHEVKERPRQAQFDFKFERPAGQGAALPGALPAADDAQRVRMVATGRLRSGSAKLRNAGEAASLLAHLRKSAQEHFYSVAVDADDNIIEVHRFSKGLGASAPASPVVVAGRVFNAGPQVKKVYFVHNHPSGQELPSGIGGDLGIHAALERMMDLKGIDSESLLIAGTKYKVFTRAVVQESGSIPPVSRRIDVPEKERVLRRVSDPGPQIDRAAVAQAVIEERYGGRDGFLYLDNQLRPIGFDAYPQGKTMAEGAAGVIARAEQLNARGVIVHSRKPLSEHTNRTEFINHLNKALEEKEFTVLDIVDGGQSRQVTGTMPPKAGSVQDATEALEKLNSSSTLYMHPSTITGPIGGLWAGVDTEEYDRTGNIYDIKIDPHKAMLGALAGTAIGSRALRNMLKSAGTAWEKTVQSKLLMPARAKVNGLIVQEDLRHALGLNRSAKFQDAMRNYRRDVERGWLKAAEFGKQLVELAPTRLEQRRLMQIVRGGVTANPEWRAKAEQANKIFEGLRKELEQHKLLEYSRFDDITRKQRAKLREIIARDKTLTKIEKAQFEKQYDITPDGIDPEYRGKGAAGQDAGSEPEWAREQIPVDAYNDLKPKTPAEWARQKLYNHYHYATAEEYAPLYYDKHEGLTPSQRDRLREEVKRLKVKSRRGNPEGDPQIEEMIVGLEKMLGEGGRARRELRKSRVQLNKRYSHQRLEIPYEIQKMLGVIEEAPYPVAKMMGVQQSDVLKGKLFEQVANNIEWARAGVDPATGRKIGVEDVPANFVKAEGEAFGKLDGMYVRKDVWDDLREVEEWRGAAVQLWDKAMGAWKFGKVVLNPATHARNFMSNVVLAYFGDVNPVTDAGVYAKAAKALSAGESNALYKEAADWGLFNDTYVSSEIGKLRDELAGLRDGKSLRRWIGKAASLPAEVYQGNEKFFKLAVFAKARAGGATVDAAARKAEHYLFNYADIPPAVKHMKRWVSPFFTFTYKALPLLAETAITKPWKVAAVGAAMYGMEAYAKGKLGMSDEEAENQRALLPEWQRRKVLGVGPYSQVLMPFTDKWGNNLYLDTSYILPFGNVAEKWGQSALPLSDLLLSNPVLATAAEIYTNRDAFTGREIYNDVLDGAGQIAGKYLQHAWREAVPSLAPGGYGFNKLKTGIQNSFMGGKDVRDWADRPMEFSSAVLSSLLGVKLSPAAERQLAQLELRTRRGIAEAVSTEMGRLKGRRRRNELSAEEYETEARRLLELKTKLLMERPKP